MQHVDYMKKTICKLKIKNKREILLITYLNSNYLQFIQRPAEKKKKTWIKNFKFYREYFVKKIKKSKKKRSFYRKLSI